MSDFTKSIFLLILTTALVDAFCPKFSVPGPKSGSCYFVLKSSQSYNLGQHFCQNYFNGGLATITNDNDNLRALLMARNVLAEYSPNSYSYLWIGGFWNGKNVTWDDGTVSGYTNFGSNNNDPGNIYMTLNDGTWSTTSYSQKQYILCQAQNTSSRGFCPKVSVTGSRSGTCYFTIDIGKSYYQAQQFCSDYFNANLASITNAFDNQLVMQVARDVLATFGDSDSSVWLGGLYNGTVVIWEDGSSNTYTNFRTNYYYQWYNVYMNLNDGTWSMRSFNDNSYAFVCMAKNGTSAV